MQNESRFTLGPFHSAWLCGLALGACVLLAQPAGAFTVEGGETNWAPKFDLEAQARQFRTPRSALTPGSGGLDMPGGKLQFGVEGANSLSGYSFDANRTTTRQQFYQMFDPSYQFNGR